MRLHIVGPTSPHLPLLLQLARLSMDEWLFSESDIEPAPDVAVPAVVAEQRQPQVPMPEPAAQDITDLFRPGL